MRDSVIPAPLKDVQEAFQVAFQISIRILYRVTHTCLGSQVDDLVEPFRLEQTVQGKLVADRHPDEAAAAPPGTYLPLQLIERSIEAVLAQPAVFQAHIVILVYVVDPDDLVSPFG